MVRPKRRDGSRCQKLGVHGSMNFKKGKILEEFLFPSPKKLGVHMHSVHPQFRHPWYDIYLNFALSLYKTSLSP